MRKPLPTTELLNELLSYDENSGELLWRMRTGDFARQSGWSQRTLGSWNAKYAGKVAGKRLRHGYVGVSILGVCYFAHRIIWKMITGFEPDHIDHADGQTNNNRFSNLHDVSAAENQKNRKRSANNKSGTTGVHWCRTTKSWVAKITIGRRAKMIGRFTARSEAVAARLAAQKEHGFHENHGRASA
ncbi:MAG TPA: HNH endonuclease signature motif containing protein [Nitrospira sp.]|nr:HNH endonuclease signature motif containing protein [Nitrospira sp.]